MITSSRRFSAVLVALALNLAGIACSSSKPLRKSGDAATDLDLGNVAAVPDLGDGLADPDPGDVASAPDFGEVAAAPDLGVPTETSDGVCTGGPALSPECQAEAAQALATFVPPDAPVHCTDAAAFCFAGRVVRLTHIAYGVENDCMAGCFSSNICAIEDPEAAGTELFSAFWTTPSEAPLGINTECPNLVSTQTWPNCVPSGRLHPLISTPEFRSFIAAQTGVGPFRWCINPSESWP
jgi:hypothetical protein